MRRVSSTATTRSGSSRTHSETSDHELRRDARLLVAERGLQLAPAARARAQLQVPARVGPAGPAPERDLGRGQAQVLVSK